MTTQSGSALLLVPSWLLLLAATGLVVLFVKLGRKGKLAMMGGGVLVVALGFAVLAVRHTRALEAYDFASRHDSFGEHNFTTGEHARVTVDTAESVAELHAAVARQEAEVHRAFAEKYFGPPPAEPWKSVADLGFEADSHPSAAAAAEALVVQVLKAKDASHPGASFKRIQIWGGQNIGPDVLSRVLTRIQREHPDWEVMPEAAEPDQPLLRTDEQAAAIQMELVRQSITHNAPWDCNRPQHGGIIRLRLTWRGGSLDRSTQFVEKPWLENASEFVSAQPQMRWVIGLSSQDAADTIKARQQAVESAAAQMLPAARARMVQSGNAGVDDRWLMARIQQALLQMTDVRDRFTQTLITPYGGQVVREAILVASPRAVQRAASDGQVQLRWARNTWFATVASGVGMCVLICIVALLLNSMTKGYYRGRIVVLAGLLLVAGLLVVIKLSGTVFVPYPVAPVADSPVSAQHGYVEY